MIDAKRYLQQIEKCDERIKLKTEDLEQLKSFTEKVTSTLSDVSVAGTKNNDKMGDAVAKIVELQDDINCEVARLADLKKEACAVLDKVSDERHYKMLYKHYVLLHSLVQCAADMHYSYRGICKLHGRALQSVQRILEGENNGQG